MRLEVYPSVPSDVLEKEVREATLKELSWLLLEIHQSLLSLRSGLEECLKLLAPNVPGSTLVLSTARSEGLKGFVTRVGGGVVKGEMQLKIPGLQNTKGLAYYRLSITQPTSTAASNPSSNPPPNVPSIIIGGESITNQPDPLLPLHQITDCRNFVQSALDALPAAAEDGGTGNGTDNSSTQPSPIVEARFMAEKLNRLVEDIRAARGSLKNVGKNGAFPVKVVDAKVFDPPLPPTLSVDVYIRDAALVTEIRTLEAVNNTSSSTFTPFALPSLSNLSIESSFGLREKLSSALNLRGGNSGHHGSGHVQNDGRDSVLIKKDEDEGVVTYKGAQVRVKERIRVESQDPSLMSVVSKLGAVEHNLGMGRGNLGIVMRGLGW